MPELPEVEIVRTQLAAHLTGAWFESSRVYAPSSVIVGGTRLRGATPEDSALRIDEAVRNRTLASVRRKGKLLVLDFGGPALLCHLKMTGQILLYEWGGIARGAGAGAGKQEGDAPGPHTRLDLWFRTERARVLLRFNDARRFGYVSVMRSREDVEAELARLGVDALEEGVGGALRRACARRRAPIKSLLLDQSVIAGIGNAYADEALHRAAIHPAQPADTLSSRQIARLADAIHDVLAEGIAAGGLSIRTYVDAHGNAGGFQHRLRVYGRDGERCVTCGGAIERLRIGGRSSWYCSTCQKRRGRRGRGR